MRGRIVYRSKTVTASYDMSRRGMAECAVGRELRDACRSVVVNHAMPYAVGISPEVTGQYRRSWRVVDTWTVLPAGDPMLRVATRLVNEAPHATAVEWGNKNTPAHHVLVKTLARLEALSGL